MHLDQFAPFPRASVNLITCASNSGKTHLLQKIFHSPGAFIEDHASIRRIIYINCNKRDIGFIHPWQQDPLDKGAFELVALGIEQLSEFEEVVEHGDAVILDDLLTLSEAVHHLINYGSHHYNLTVFIVTQSCLASPLYSLVSSVHNIVLFFKNSSTSRLAHHLLHQFFHCSETKKYLQRIFAQAERDKCILVLKINCVATSPRHKAILAYSHIERLFEGTSLPHCQVYPELGYRDAIMEETSLQKIKVPAKLAASLGSDTFLLVPAKNVLIEAPEEEEKDAKKEAAACPQREWEEMVEFLENEIESSFPFKRWMHAKNLLKELLRCSDLCISADYRLCFIKTKSAMSSPPKHKHFSIVDFLNLATRHSAPGEMASQKILDFVPLVRMLLAHAIPHTYIQNKMLLQAALAHGGRVKKHVHK
jgi:predicted ATPase